MIAGTGARTALAVLLALVTALLAGAPSAAAAPAAPPAAALTPADLDAWLDGVVPAGLDRAGIAGAAVTVVRDGQVLTSRGYGVAGAGVPVDPTRTLFRVGSVAKVFTATAVLQLVEQGRIDLDADVRTYLDFPLPLQFEPPVTMRHLLTHSAGFEERIRGLITLGETTEDLRDHLATDPPEQVFPPGTTPAYSNYGYGLAGYVVARVSGMPYPDYLQRHVLDPVGMTSSSAAQPLPPPLRDRLSSASPTVDDPAAPFETVRPSPAGSLTASPDDMGRFMLAELGPPSLLSPATQDLMRRPGLGAGTLGGLAEGPRTGLGLFDESRNGRRILGHGGDTQFFHAHLQLYPAERTGIFVALNGSGRGAMDSHELREAVLHGFTDRYFPGGTDPGGADTGGATGSADRAVLAQGTYESARAPFSTFLSAMNLVGQVTVVAQPDGTLLFAPGPLSAQPAVYRELRPWVWQEVGGQRIVAGRVEDGRVTALGVEGAFTMLPAPPWRNGSLVVPVLVGAVVVLLAALVAWPAGAWVRRRYGRAVVTPRVDRLALLTTRLGAAAAVVALGGWTAVVVTLLGLGEVPTGVLAGLVVLQAAGALAVVPAAASVVTGVRRRAGGPAVSGRLLLLLALVAVAGVAATYGLISTDLGF
ncbi:serine hydrolase domain-containing protein [Actinomycetospora flava]|uniref:Serine hydrolase domain-containing protein n=1 Tax=Actinomycetospora flava TaxID=3129232 RepID=A0ABU8M381_9PSEU